MGPLNLQPPARLIPALAFPPAAPCEWNRTGLPPEPLWQGTQDGAGTIR